MLTNLEIYNTNNSVRTIEHVYVKPMLKEIEYWERIASLLWGDDRDEALDTLHDLNNQLSFYHEHKHLLRS